MSSFAFLFLISIPIFYIWGFISFVIFIKDAIKGDEGAKSKVQSRRTEIISSDEPKLISQKPVITVQHKNIFFSLSNINLLLYIGAFFLITAISIFVSFSYEELSNWAKMGLVVVFTFSFYFFWIDFVQ